MREVHIMAETSQTNQPGTTAGLRLPAMRGRQGGRDTYMTSIKMSAFAEQIPVLTDTPKKDLKEQRIYDPGHAGRIASYLATVDDYVLPPLVVSVDREPRWLPGECGGPFG